MTAQYKIEYDERGVARQTNAPATSTMASPPQQLTVSAPPRHFAIPSILKTASVFVMGMAALAGAEKFGPEGWRPSTIVGTYDARIASAVKAAELNQQARFEGWAAQVKVATDQNAEAYRAALNVTLANYQASYDRSKILAQAAADIQNRYVEARMNQVSQQTGAETTIINLASLLGHGLNLLETGSGEDALAYSQSMSREVSERLTSAAQQGARIDIAGWDTGLQSPDAMRAELASIKPVPIPAPPVLGEQPVTMSGQY